MTCTHCYIYSFVVNLFLAVLGFCRCAQAFSSCGQRRLLSSCRTEALGRLGFSTCTRVQLLRGMCDLWDQGSNLCPFIGRLVLIHRATREALVKSSCGTIISHQRQSVFAQRPAYCVPVSHLAFSCRI